ncbi:MAG: response regulator transcription factor [Sporocytophaga sp.]|uniref:LytR/AlgR family response regulator transcription factor n=1 Tax=Sporocytophaga sp. TaxID=2231183 RepID=UPI001B201795|nr:LytTR family DNA-binding domain-containing protein [Sporocytophaga sp.]MBO9703446.1 response regulator transcription factor [Sporocytophaga sp.]
MIRCIAIDDEPLALDIIENYISKLPELQLEGRYTNPLEALEVLNKNTIDLLFLDIQMSELSGIQLLKALPNPPIVIFTTAYQKYALEGYELDVVDYLLKPIPFERFLKAVNKVKDLLSLQKSTADQNPLKDFIFVKSDYQMVKINLDDIIYIEGLKDYVKIFAGVKPIFAHQNMKSIESKLTNDFLRIHKSYIISLKKIEAVQKNMVKIAGIELPVGEIYKEQLFKIINENS